MLLKTCRLFRIFLINEIAVSVNALQIESEQGF
jgi:hypothetical protein